MTHREVPHVPVSPPPSPETWQALAQVTEALGRLAPWRWMHEAHVFGVQDPQTGLTGYLSITGQSDEARGLMVYLGQAGWEAFWTLMHFLAEATTVPDEIWLEMPALRIAWVPEENLTDVDRDLVVWSGRFREGDHRPTWRSLRPGYAPWYPDASEARFLVVAIEQALHVAERFRETGADLLLDRLAQGEVLLRVAREPDGPWEDRWVPPPPAITSPTRARVPARLLEALRAAPQASHPVEVDLFPLPAAVQEAPDERPYIPYVLVVADSSSGEALGVDLLDARRGLEAMHASVPSRVAEHLLARGRRPPRVLVRRPLLLALLAPLDRKAGIPLERRTTLPAADEIRVHLWHRVQNP